MLNTVIKEKYVDKEEPFSISKFSEAHKPDDISSPQIDGILSIADKISREAKKEGALVSIESTIPSTCAIPNSYMTLM